MLPAPPPRTLLSDRFPPALLLSSASLPLPSSQIQMENQIVKDMLEIIRLEELRGHRAARAREVAARTHRSGISKGWEAYLKRYAKQEATTILLYPRA
ncbi:uncharacterized protein TRIREDRAFT_106267 [Trichoderma reesei QM6a]|uniref:Predicted protein n=1 Tax=Hypocrea jecorina (strain QM6a) TaxID=431241 RepID=G0RHG8_HYPJQ|nr:uncharacterized protein TRIREDRAFT_106267 [Trichoderma reesei QM6a]EGR49504.1 predicted protein [Trichoderma reesei QM6a]